MRCCHRCGAEWTAEKRAPSIKETCPACNAYLHCCLNCEHHDRSRHNECRIPNTDCIARRDDANFCDEFVFAEGPCRTNEPSRGSERSAFDALFGDQDENDADDARSDLDKLFGD